MKQGSDFRNHTLPWILYAIGVAATAVIIVCNCIFKPDLLPVLDTLAFVFLGLVAGFCLILFTNRKFQKNVKGWSKKDYFGMKNSMIFCWVCCLFVNATSTDFSWVYAVCLPISTGCAAYLSLYIPEYIRLKDEIAKRQQQTP